MVVSAFSHFQTTAGSDARIAELKVFNSLDGVGLNLAHTMRIKTGFITGRRSHAVYQRAKECHVDLVYLGQATKTEALEESVLKAQVSADEVAYMGDDLPDMAIAQRVGLAVAVANAPAHELRAICHYQTRTRGGTGTTREVIELILKAQGDGNKQSHSPAPEGPRQVSCNNL